MLTYPNLTFQTERQIQDTNLAFSLFFTHTTISSWCCSYSGRNLPLREQQSDESTYRFYRSSTQLELRSAFHANKFLQRFGRFILTSFEFRMTLPYILHIISIFNVLELPEQKVSIKLEIVRNIFIILSFVQSTSFVSEHYHLRLNR